MPKESIDNQEFEQKLKDDFRYFAWYIWKYLNLPAPTPIQMDIARFLDKGPKRRIICGFRGVGKSWLTAAYVCWKLYKDKNYRILVVSASHDHAMEFSTFVLQLITTCPVLQHLTPDKNGRSSKLSFDVAGATPDKAPSVRSVGVFGQLQGPRADEIVPDDVEAQGNSATRAKRDRLRKVVAEFDAVVKPGGRVTYLGTPQCGASLYSDLSSRFDEDGHPLYVMRIWPSEIPSKKQAQAYGNRLAPMIVKMKGQPGDPTEPTRFDRADLSKRKLSFGLAGYRLQFMLDTSSSDALRYPLRLNDLVNYNCDMVNGRMDLAWQSGDDKILRDVDHFGQPGQALFSALVNGDARTAPYDDAILVVDPSGRGKDETVYMVMKTLNGKIFLVDLGATTEGYADTTLKGIAAMAAKHKVSKVLVESNFGDGMFSKILQPVLNRFHPCTVEEVRVSTMKEKRIIDTLEPVMSCHRLVVDPIVWEQDAILASQYPTDSQHYRTLSYQISYLQDEKGALSHDDRVDCLHLGVAYFSSSALIDAQKDLDRRHVDDLDNQIRIMESESTRFLQAKGGSTYRESSEWGTESSTGVGNQWGMA